jgi:nucleotide-binding universal stress UspA family protein
MAMRVASVSPWCERFLRSPASEEYDMFCSLLLAIDGSPPSHEASDLAIRVAHDANARITCVSALDVVPGIGTAGVDLAHIDTDAIVAERRVEAQAIVDVVIEAAARVGVRCNGRVIEGRPVAAILAAARDSSAELIVMGTHGRAGLARAVLGSVAESVLREADVPVLVVPARPGSRA